MGATSGRTPRTSPFPVSSSHGREILPAPISKAATGRHLPFHRLFQEAGMVDKKLESSTLGQLAEKAKRSPSHVYL